MLLVDGTATTTFVVLCCFLFIPYLSGCAPLRASVKLCLCQCYLLFVDCTCYHYLQYLCCFFLCLMFMFYHSLICPGARPCAPQIASVKLCLCQCFLLTEILLATASFVVFLCSCLISFYFYHCFGHAPLRASVELLFMPMLFNAICWWYCYHDFCCVLVYVHLLFVRVRALARLSKALFMPMLFVGCTCYHYLQYFCCFFLCLCSFSYLSHCSGRAPSHASVRFCKALLMPMLFVDWNLTCYHPFRCFFPFVHFLISFDFYHCFGRASVELFVYAVLFDATCWWYCYHDFCCFMLFFVYLLFVRVRALARLSKALLMPMLFVICWLYLLPLSSILVLLLSLLNVHVLSFSYLSHCSGGAQGQDSVRLFAYANAFCWLKSYLLHCFHLTFGPGTASSIATHGHARSSVAKHLLRQASHPGTSAATARIFCQPLKPQCTQLSHQSDSQPRCIVLAAGPWSHPTSCPLHSPSCKLRCSSTWSHEASRWAALQASVLLLSQGL